MGLFGKITGTRHPEGGITPRAAGGLRTSLFSLNQPDVPYVIRDDTAHDAGLAAEWRIAEPARQTFFIGSQLTHAPRIRMRLVEESHQVRAAEEQGEVTRAGNPPRLPASAEYSRGSGRAVSRRWTLRAWGGRPPRSGGDLRFRQCATDRPPAEHRPESGWTWRGAVFGKP